MASVPAHQNRDGPFGLFRKWHQPQTTPRGIPSSSPAAIPDDRRSTQHQSHLPLLLFSLGHRPGPEKDLKRSNCQDLEALEANIGKCQDWQACDKAVLDDSCEDGIALLGVASDLCIASLGETSGNSRQTAKWHVKLACLLGMCILILISSFALYKFTSLDQTISQLIAHGAQRHVRRRKPPPIPKAPPVPPAAPAELTFYMYRAQSDADYPLQNVNAANLPGVMWYLHNEIVVTTPRKYGVTRVLRFKITMKNTQELFNATRLSFGPFVAFDSAQCTVPGCSDIWRNYGYVVGCQKLDPALHRYMSPSTHRAGAWYSLPGPCPSEKYDSKSQQCSTLMPGGSCEHVTGHRNCTYHTESAGEVSLDELVGIDNYAQFFRDGGQEYDITSDKGKGLNFWDNKHDRVQCDRRAKRLQEIFATKYPDLPATLDDPREC